MPINSINSLVSFKQIPFLERNNIKIVSGYKIPVKNDSDVFVKVESDYEENEHETVIKREYSSSIARGKFEIDKKKRILKAGNMDVFKEHQKGKGFGIVLHLNNIMEMLENDLDKIELYSLGQAVLFHGKCKFEPRLRGSDEIMETLYSISEKDSEKIPQLKEIVKEAGEYFDEIHFTNGIYCLNPQKLEYANSLVSRYIEAVNSRKLTPEEKEEYGFMHGFDMVLTKEKVLENKDFFNGLFKKFDIDYEI